MKLSLLLLSAALALLACGPSVRPVFESESDAATSDSTADTAATDTAPGVDTAPPAGELGAPCANDKECSSGYCLPIGRCSKACPAAGVCPSSPNWSCLVIPGRGPMCTCDEKSKSEIACNNVDDNCDSVIDEGSTKCGDVCVDFGTDPKNCGMCGKICPSGANSEPTCAAATCGLKCTAGFDNCDGNAANGCEASLSSSAHCGKCGSSCKAGESCVGGKCSTTSPVDVNILLDVSGSTQTQLNAAIPALQSKLAGQLLALGDVQVGVSYTSDFPVSPYGSSVDRAFEGGIEPTTTESKIFAAISGYLKGSGGDAADGMIEGLAGLSGATLQPSSVPLVCSPGRSAGGCWRPEARKVIVLFTDDIFHGGPHPTMAGLYEPYTGITPAPLDWTAVSKAMTSAKVTLLIMAATSSSTGAGDQYKKMLTDLGQPATDIYASGNTTEVDTAAAAIVARVKALKGG